MIRADVDVRARASARGDVVTAEALRLLGHLQRAYGGELDELLAARDERRRAPLDGRGLRLDLSTAAVRRADWRIVAPPDDLRDRRVEITGPATRRLMASALDSEAQVFMADLEDSLAPTWANVVDAHANLRDAASGHIGTRPDGPTLTVRPRGLHLTEPRVLVDGRPCAAALFDVALLATNVAPPLRASGRRLYLYLPKLEAATEARWWEAVLAEVEEVCALPHGGIRTTVLIETLPAAFAMDEILWEQRGRVTALNAGRWDYLFSVIKYLGDDPAHVLPDRSALTMSVPFLAAYATRLVAACHRRGAHAIGGMAALLPNRRDPAADDRARAHVRQDKLREAHLGYDGTWVAHPDLIDVARGAFAEVLGSRPAQLAALPSDTPEVAALLDTRVPGARVTVAGARANVSVALRYIAAWLGGTGAVAIDGLMEDAATAEIARSQLWQWIHHGSSTDDGTVVTRALVDDLVTEEVSRLQAPGVSGETLPAAAELLRRLVLADELAPYFTTA